MIQLSIGVASLALMGLATSNPTPQAFSFAQWARQIGANPKGDHLSPEEAIAAFKNNTHPSVIAKDDRYGCGNAPDHPAYGPDAVYCTNYLAGLGDQRCEVHGVTSTFCSWYGAEAVAVIAGELNYDTTPCRHAAEILGGIMDRCYNNDNDRVQGYGYPTNTMQLNLGSPQ